MSFILACWSTARSTKNMIESKEVREKAVNLLRKLGVEKIYLSSYDHFLIPSDQLKDIAAFFEAEGFLTAGGVGIGLWGEGFGERNINFGISRAPGHHICLTSQASRDGLKKIMETTSKVFDIILIDDHWANFCYCDRCLELFRKRYGFKGEAKDLVLAIARNDPKITREWEMHAFSLIKEVSEKYVIEPAKKVNPRVKLILKVAEWYEKFNHRGIPLKEIVSIFDGLYVGTESRENTARYGSYFLPQYVRKIAGEKYKGSWFDTLNGYNYSVPISEQIYIEQARMSVLGQSPEITLFCLGDLLDPRKTEHVSRLRAELPALRRISSVVLTTKPIGITVIKPFRSPHATSHPETYIFDILGTIGIPLNPVPELSPEDKNILVTAHGAHSLKVDLLKEKDNIFLTSGAIFQLAKEKNVDVLKIAGLDVENPIEKDFVQARALTLAEEDFPRIIDHRRPSAIPFGPALRTSTASPLIIAHDEDGDYIVATKNVYGDTNIYCLSFTWFPWYLKIGYTESIRQVFRNVIGDAIGFKINAQGEGLGNITLHAYENGIFAIENLDNTYYIVELHINPEKIGLAADKLRIKDFMSGYQLQSQTEGSWVKIPLHLNPAQLTVLKIEK